MCVESLLGMSFALPSSYVFFFPSYSHYLGAMTFVDEMRGLLGSQNDTYTRSLQGKELRFPSGLQEAFLLKKWKKVATQMSERQKRRVFQKALRHSPVSETWKAVHSGS